MYYVDNYQLVFVESVVFATTTCWSPDGVGPTLFFHGLYGGRIYLLMVDWRAGAIGDLVEEGIFKELWRLFSMHVLVLGLGFPWVIF